MHRRKVQKTGGSTFFVTLPKEWADSVGIEAGATVTLMESESGALVVVPASLSGRNQCVIPLEEWSFDRLQREVISRYIVGYDLIEIRGHRIRPEQRRMIREIAQGLVGLEIFEETHAKVVLHAIVNTQDFPVEKTLSRVYDITRAMLSDAVAAFCRHDNELALDVIERDGDVDRLVLLVTRQFSLILRDLMIEEETSLSRLEFLYHQAAADQLERVADHATKISEATNALEDPIGPRVVDDIQRIASESLEILDQAVRSFMTADLNLANRVLDGRKREERLFELALMTNGEEYAESVHSISIVLDSLLRIREYGFNIAENALDVPASTGSSNRE